MLKYTLQIGLGLLLLAGCRPPQDPVIVVNNPPKKEGDTTIIQQPGQTVPKTGGAGHDTKINVDIPKENSKPSESSLTDASGRILTGKIGTPPTEDELGVPVFVPSQITETDAGAYRLETSEGTVLGMSFATERSQDEVKTFYEQKLTGWSWDANNNQMSGMYEGKKVNVTIQPGATSAFEIQVWL